MRIARWLGLLAALLGGLADATPARACGYARHTRLFPLGLQGERLVALELDLTRGFVADEPDSPVRVLAWRGPGRLLTFDPTDAWAGLAIAAGELARTPPEGYGRGVEALLARALEACATLPGFTPAPPPVVTVCRGGPRCGPFELEHRHGEQLVLTHGGGRRRIERALSVPGELTELAADHAGLAEAEILDEVRMLSVARYALSGRAVFVVTLAGTGRPSREQRRFARRRCGALAACVLPEPALDHDLAFDLLVSVPAPS